MTADFPSDSDDASLVAKPYAGDNAEPLTVSEISQALKRTVEDRFGFVRLRGELSGVKRAASGHMYCALKDENAVLAIAAQLQAKETDVRIAAIRALGTTKHPSATPLVTDALEDPNAEIRRAATLAVADLEDKSARKDLQAQMDKEQDDELKSMMRDTLKKL